MGRPKVSQEAVYRSWQYHMETKIINFEHTTNCVLLILSDLLSRLHSIIMNSCFLTIYQGGGGGGVSNSLVINVPRAPGISDMQIMLFF